MKKQFIAGVVTGGLVFGALGVFAGQYVATDNPFPVEYNGNSVRINGYNIDGSTYFKLRDVADVVGGFTVDFADNTIKLNSATTVASNGDGKGLENVGSMLTTKLPLDIKSSTKDFTINSLGLKFIEYSSVLDEAKISYVANVSTKKDGMISFYLNYLDKDGFSLGKNIILKSDAKASQTYNLTDTTYVPKGTTSITITNN